MVFRDPVPQRAMQTFGIVRPKATHYRPATCAEVGCEPHRNGWATTLLADSDDLAFVVTQVCAGLVDGHRRTFTREPAPDGMVRLTFTAGQPCFRASAHRVPLEREPIYLVRPGDRRANLTGLPEIDLGLAQRLGRIHTRPEHWVEESAETLDRVRTVREKG